MASRLTLVFLSAFIFSCWAPGHAQNNLKLAGDGRKSQVAYAAANSGKDGDRLQDEGKIGASDISSAGTIGRDDPQPALWPTIDRALSRLVEALFGIQRTIPSPTQSIEEHFNKLTFEEKQRALSRCDEIIRASLRVSQEMADICVVVAREKRYGSSRD